jgi:hypothetical protein
MMRRFRRSGTEVRFDFDCAVELDGGVANRLRDSTKPGWSPCSAHLRQLYGLKPYANWFAEDKTVPHVSNCVRIEPQFVMSRNRPAWLYSTLLSAWHQQRETIAVSTHRADVAHCSLHEFESFASVHRSHWFGKREARYISTKPTGCPMPKNRAATWRSYVKHVRI